MNRTTLRSYSALQMFVARARATRPDFDPTGDDAEQIVAICRRLDGLPLAIELAAARVRELVSPEARSRPGAIDRMLPLLETTTAEAPPRHRSMEVAIAWSYGLLTPDDQALFRRISTFAGGFTAGTVDALARGREAGAEHPVNGGPFAEGEWVRRWRDQGMVDVDWSDTPELAAIGDPRGGLRRLVDHGLVRRVVGDPGDAIGSEARFDLLHVMREFGRDRLAEHGEATAAHLAHAEWVLGWSVVAGIALWGNTAPTWFATIEAELGNLRAALDWVTTDGGEVGTEIALRAAEGVGLFWQTRGLAGEGLGWLERAVACPGGSPLARARTLTEIGLLAWMVGNQERADAALAAALPFWQETGHRLGEARARQFAAAVAWRRGDLERMAELTAAALACYRDWQAPHGIALCQVMLAIVTHLRGEASAADGLLVEARGLSQAIEFPWGVAVADLYAGELARIRGRRTAAAARYGAALQGLWAHGDPWGTGAAMTGLVALVTDRQDAPLAARLLGAATSLRDRASPNFPHIDHDPFKRARKQLTVRLGERRFTRANAGGRVLAGAEAVVEAKRLAQRLATAPGNPATSDPLASLTPQTRRVLEMTAGGKTARQIADALSISSRTVEWHRREGYAKLGITRRELPALVAGDHRTEGSRKRTAMPREERHP